MSDVLVACRAYLFDDRPTDGDRRPGPMSMREWEKKVLSEENAARRVSEIEDELRQIVFDGSLRAEIDSTASDPDLAVD